MHSLSPIPLHYRKELWICGMLNNAVTLKEIASS